MDEEQRAAMYAHKIFGCSDERSDLWRKVYQAFLDGWRHCSAEFENDERSILQTFGRREDPMINRQQAEQS